MPMTISAVILAGGQGKRMGGVDKGLQLLQGKPLVEHILQRLKPQLTHIAINANRHLPQYAQYGYPVFNDELTGFQGPLSGMLTGLKRATSDYVLFVPCDCPYLPLNLVEKFSQAIHQQAPVAYADDGERSHPTFCLLSKKLITPLSTYLAQGERKVLTFFQQQQALVIDFSEQKQGFININWREGLDKNNQK
ncbi:molybdenum cofactor guanylyltransferase [Volucribacter psittacicida]|uniref:Molybdenum cofactor guanylyltransferase n=1 Tax=Volucribacter psittacicida TaxID=203482 RepID=A0A4R1FM02_9PAST|nr:molybdenum cofactor guanylyltransferase MobA [Volucribacter psittacicida]TCJ95837.1 molybdenum cofactor guanylyltransferase [Volucribacter psittacicida]